MGLSGLRKESYCRDEMGGFESTVFRRLHAVTERERERERSPTVSL